MDNRNANKADSSVVSDQVAQKTERTAEKTADINQKEQRPGFKANESTGRTGLIAFVLLCVLLLMATIGNGRTDVINKSSRLLYIHSG